ncbi:hypothetical protein NEIELOOT_00431 [Neisseria elongata subsp. glycolytica ATCC 29315]|uniref:Uncharacterized protein n=1 Tax=Neisseria elongata subsp. glycolytica ATCC 29315 TaxID=546263 RepID=D4DN07_NEIEG|nr:hypothetical protein NEIELOOT_00431 [Neisseria elongata subsp. glycolytica ATCC 29315]
MFSGSLEAQKAACTPFLPSFQTAFGLPENGAGQVSAKQTYLPAITL